jgi:class 3 adenylate cyclase
VAVIQDEQGTTVVAPAARGAGAPVRLLVWSLHLALPLLGLWLLIAQPRFDARWEHHPSHFWLVLGVAAVNVALGAAINEAARRRTDARLFLVSLAFSASAGFLLLHALATPGVLLDRHNLGFAIATPVGLFLAAVLASLSSIELRATASAALMRRAALIRGALAAVLLSWAAASLAELPPLADSPAPREVAGPMAALAFAAVALYANAALRYWQLHQRRPSVMLIGVLTAWALLAEAMVAVVFARNWHASWWLWHLLMAAGFGFVAYSAYVQYQREGRARGLFNAIALEQTVAQLRQEHAAALEALVTAMRQGEQAGGHDPARTDLIAAGLAARFGLSEGQAAVLGRAAEALAGERDQIRRLDGLVAIGRESTVILREDELLRRAVGLLGEALPGEALRLGLVREGELVFPSELSTAAPASWPASDERDAAVARLLADAGGPVSAGDGLLLLPLTVKGQAAGVVEIAYGGQLRERDRSVFSSLASQLSITLENVRLYRQIDALFHQYMSPDVATALLADPGQAALGGAEVEVTVLFADLRGFTGFSETSAPEQVVAMLNRYFAEATPCILEEGGTVVQFIGDAVMALFNSPARQPDHALRAARAALAMQARIAAVHAGRPEWPRFRIGVNTGSALVGNVGSSQFRSFSAMGDAVNVAARLESVAEPGHVVIGERTWAAIKDAASATPLGRLRLKGRTEPVRAWTLTGLSEGEGVGAGSDGNAERARESTTDGGDMSDGPSTEQPGQDPDAQPNSDEGAASSQAAQAGDKEQSEGGEDKA